MNLQTIKQLKKYANQWVALTHPDNKVVGSGRDAVEASRVAEQKGHHEVVLFKVFPVDGYYAPITRRR